jgi:hypothetical protein
MWLLSCRFPEVFIETIVVDEVKNRLFKLVVLAYISEAIIGYKASRHLICVLENHCSGIAG